MLADDMACNARNPRPGKVLVLTLVTKNNNLPLTIISSPSLDIHLKRLKRSLIQTKSLHTKLLKSKLLFFEINFLN